MVGDLVNFPIVYFIRNVSLCHTPVVKRECSVCMLVFNVRLELAAADFTSVTRLVIDEVTVGATAVHYWARPNPPTEEFVCPHVAWSQQPYPVSDLVDRCWSSAVIESCKSLIMYVLQLFAMAW